MNFKRVFPATRNAAVLVVLLPVAVLTAEPETTPPDITSTSGAGEAPAAVSSPGNLIVNGDFEFSSYEPGCHFNQSNTDVSANLSGVTAWGKADEIDYLNNGSVCAYSGPPQSGSSQVAIGRYAGSGFADEFCFELDSTVVAGESYVVSFYVLASTLFDETIGAVEIGLSLEPTSFGTLVAIGLGDTSDWTYVEQQFVAPVNGDYLCVSPEANVDSWNFLDNFTLSQETVSSERTSWGTVRSMYR